MQKNVKGFVGLFAGILAFVFIIIAMIPTTEIRDSGIMFYGSNNPTFALIAVPLGIVAIVAGIMSKKDKDKKGPRKSGVILGVIAIIIGLIAAMATFALSFLTTYANNPNDPMFESMSKEDKANLDKAIDQIIESSKTQS